MTAKMLLSQVHNVLITQDTMAVTSGRDSEVSDDDTQV